MGEIKECDRLRQRPHLQNAWVQFPFSRHFPGLFREGQGLLGPAALKRETAQGPV